MIQKILFVFSSYDIVIGIIITVLAIFTVEFVRSLTNDIILPLFLKNIDNSTITIYGKTLRTGLFLTILIRYIVVILLVFIIIHKYPVKNGNGS